MYIYLITSDIIDAVKVGIWSESSNKLVQRYKTYFGANICAFLYKYDGAYALEKMFKQHFADLCMFGELFEKSPALLEKYKHYLASHTLKRPIPIQNVVLMAHDDALTPTTPTHTMTEKQRRIRKTYPEYECVRCGYKTREKGDMKKHFYTRVDVCPAVLCNIELDEEVKTHILKNRVYLVSN
jgi:hypothetical protein